MKLSANRASAYYHDVVNFVDKITLDGVMLTNVVDVDLDKGTILCITQPIQEDGTGHVKTHEVKGKIDIIWRSMGKSDNGLVDPNRMFLFLKTDWERREERRKADAMNAPEPWPVEDCHELYSDADIDKPPQILDQNGQIVLMMCKSCGRAEIELQERCSTPVVK